MKTKRGSTHGGRAKRALRTEASNLAAASRPATKRKGGDSVPAQVGAAAMTMREPQGSLVGRRVGRAKQNVLDAAARPEKKQRDVYVDTSEPATSADQRKVGYGHTAKRNTKLNTAGMAYSIEDSTKARPSRKSTRGATNRIKTGGNLTRRTKRRLHGPKSRASRANPS